MLGTNGSTLNVTGYAVNDGNGGNNYTVTLNYALGTITPATLTYVANANSMNFGGSVPSLSGTVTGFVGGDTLGSATTGTLAFNTTATSLSPVGSYAITGSGLTANHGNYTFAQAARNATALTVNSRSASPTSQFLANVNGNTPNNNVSINFQNPGTPVLVHIAFNSPTTAAGNQTNNDASPAALPPGAAFTRNHGLNFQPISQYDANQYSQFKLTDYDDKDGEATIFTIIARAVAHDHAADFMINGFWNGTANDWHGANGNNPLTGKVTYSDGAGHDVVPADTEAFPIVPGKTDIAQLLKAGPVMLGGAPGHTPAEWLLALNLTPDGKGIVCADPITGKLVEIADDPTTETLGSVTGIFDPKIKGFVALADAGGEIPAAAAAAVAALQGFVPSTFFAVTNH